PVACRVVVRPVGPAPIEEERQEPEYEHGRSQGVAPRREVRLGLAEPFRQALPERGQADPRPDAPDAEADDEEVVALTYLAPLHRDLAAAPPGVAIPEIQVERQPQRE